MSRTDFSQLEELERLLEGRSPAGKPSFIINDDLTKGPLFIDINGAKTMPMERPKEKEAPKAEKKAEPKKEFKKQEVTKIEATRLHPDHGPIRRFDHEETTLGNTNRENQNALLRDNIDYQGGLEKEKATASQRKDQTREAVGGRAAEIQGMAKNAYSKLDAKSQIQSKLLRNLVGRLNEPIDVPNPSDKFDSTAFQQSLKDQLDGLKEKEDVTELDKMISGLGPVLVGLLAGGNAGMDSLKISNAELDRARKELADDRKIRIQSMGRKIHGVGNIANAEAAMRKAQVDRVGKVEEITRGRIKDVMEVLEKGTQTEKDLLFQLLSKDENFQKTLLDNDSKFATETGNRAFDQNKEFNKLAQDGLKSYVDTEQKATDHTELDERNDADNDAVKALQKMRDEAAMERERFKAQADLDKERLKSTDPKSDKVMKNSSDLRKEFQGRKVVQQYNDVKIAYDKVKAAANNPSAAGDLSLVFGYMKMLDPGSTVREGEFANAQNASGIPDRIRNMYNRALSGERLGSAQRQDFVTQAQYLAGAHAQAMKEVENEFAGYAKEYGIDSKLIFQSRAGGSGGSAKPKTSNKKALSAEDQQAIDWAKKNPKDPRAKEILKENGL